MRSCTNVKTLSVHVSRICTCCVSVPNQLDSFYSKCLDHFKGYGVETDKNTMYRTCNSEYGYYAPNAYTIPTRFYPLNQKFSNEVVRFGMYRNFSLNTEMDSTFY